MEMELAVVYVVAVIGMGVFILHSYHMAERRRLEQRLELTRRRSDASHLCECGCGMQSPRAHFIRGHRALYKAAIEEAGSELTDDGWGIVGNFRTGEMVPRGRIDEYLAERAKELRRAATQASQNDSAPTVLQPNVRHIVDENTSREQMR